MQTRDADRPELPQILAIFNEVVTNSTAIYFQAPVDLDNREAGFDARKAAGDPVIVTVEPTEHVHADRRREGVGRAILEDLIVRARTKVKHVMLGGAMPTTQARSPCTPAWSRAVALFKEVGRKFDRWLDLVFVQKRF